ncbi:MAG: type II toxin-antitoxin system RelE/ParE family toxin [Betaproteobacteria bacterium]|nr:type II toxin-antitoxin system RelE/ParE family toxin [Betaproteobacteria bacterium]
MALRWTTSARADLVRLHEFLQPINPRPGALAVRHIVAGARRIPGRPRLGQGLREFTGREVRRLLIGEYELRYELAGRDVFVLRIFHTREDR